MSETKKTRTADTEAVKEETETVKAEPEAVKEEKPANPWKEMVSIRLPRATSNEPKAAYAAVNGRAYQVPRGKMVEVPRPIYDVLMRQEAAKDALEDYRSTIPK